MAFELNQERAQTLYQALSDLSSDEQTHISLPFFSEDEIKAMIDATANLDFRTATKIVGNNVHQDMEVCFPAPRIDVFNECAQLLEEGVNSWPERSRYVPTKLYLNDFAVQRYGPDSIGIGIHKDGLRYKYFVFIITLAGQSRLFHTDDRDGAVRHKIDDEPGRLVIIKAPDFKGFDAKKRLLHGVDMIGTGRLSLGFRCEVTAAPLSD